MTSIKTPLSWVGAKTSLLTKLDEYITQGERYIEPFLGGGSSFLHRIQKGGFERYVGTDLNPTLCLFWQVLASDQYAELIAAVLSLAGLDNTKAEYEQLRSTFNERKRQVTSEEDLIQLAALFYRLNKTCFNGLYRENKKGEFNVPFGNRPFKPDIATLQAVHTLLAQENVLVIHAHFTDVMPHADAGDTIYLDPPYTSVQQGFKQYTSGGFDREQHELLAEMSVLCRKTGVNVVLSNANNEVTKEIYRDFQLETVTAADCVGGKNQGRRKEIIGILL